MTARDAIRPRQNLKADVASVIREEIFSGALRPGSRLDQDGLAARLGVSKLPVREALIGLEAEGLVLMEPRRGAYVAALTERDIRDHFRIFGAVAALAAESAAEQLTDEQLDNLAEILQQMRTSEDFEVVRGLNHAFHREINRAGSRRLQRVLKTLASSMPSRFYEFAEGWESSAHTEHEEILAALRARAPERAAAATMHHFRRNGQLAVALLQESGFWADES